MVLYGTLLIQEVQFQANKDMSILQVRIKGKTFIAFGSTSLSFIRSVNETKDTAITYSNGTGQTMTAGQVLYSQGNEGTPGYLAVKSKEDITLRGSGGVPLTVTSYPSDTQGNKTVSFNFDGSAININLTYNSNPVTVDVIVETDSRVPYVFKAADFTTKYSDYDNDGISEIALFGDVTGFSYNGIPYVAGTYINIANVTLLVYTPLDQDAPYEKNVTWKAKDVNGNISV